MRTHSKLSSAADERGMALLIAVTVLLLISVVGLVALQHASDESTGSGRSRRKTATLFVADSGLELVEDQLATPSQFPDITPIDQPTFMADAMGFTTAIYTGTTESSVPQPIERVGMTRLEGGQLNVNSSNTLSYGIYRTGVVANDPVGGRVQLRAQYSVAEGSAGYK